MFYYLFILLVADTSKAYFNNNLGEQYIDYNMDFSLSKFNCPDCPTCSKTDQSISIPVGKECILSIKTTDIPDNDYIFSHFNCPAVGSAIENALCYIDVYNGKFINGNNPKHGSSYDGKLSDYINNNTQVTVRLRNINGKSTAVFGEPTIKFSKVVYENQELPSNIEKLKNHKKSEVIKTTIKLNDGIVKLSSLHLINPHKDLTTQVGNLHFGEYLDLMFIPIIANSSHIIGVNVIDDTFLHAWHISKNTVDKISEVYLEMNLKARSNDFQISYILMKVETKSLRDAIEKWHIEFSEIYDSQEFGTGTWLPFSDVDRCFKDKRQELLDVFNAKFQWGPYPTTAEHSIPTFAYVEPTLLHTNIPYVEGKTILEMVNECPTKSDMCDIIKKYAVKNSKGELNGYAENYGHSTKTITSSIAYDGSARKWLEDNWLWPKLKEGFSTGFPHSGIGLDSMSNINPTYQLDNCKDDIPYYLVDPNGNSFVVTSGCHFSLMKRERINSSRGYMINSANSLPQMVPFLATSGYETLLSSSSNLVYTAHYYMRIWGQRFNMGSRALVYLESVTDYTQNLLEEIFSVLFVSGATVSPNMEWSKCEILNKWKPFYEKYTPLIKKTVENKTFYANGLGNVEASHDQWSSWCENSSTLEKIKCYTLIMKDSDKDAWINVNGFKEIEFIAPGVKTSIDDNNNISIKGSKFRAVVIRSEWKNPKTSSESNPSDDDDENGENNPDKKGSKTGMIIGIVVGVVVVVVAAIVATILIIRAKRRQGTTSEGDI